MFLQQIIRRPPITNIHRIIYKIKYKVRDPQHYVLLPLIIICFNVQWLKTSPLVWLQHSKLITRNNRSDSFLILSVCPFLTCRCLPQDVSSFAVKYISNWLAHGKYWLISWLTDAADLNPWQDVHRCSFELMKAVITIAEKVSDDNADHKVTCSAEK